MSNEEILRKALGEVLEFIAALPKDAMLREDIENTLKKALGGIAIDGKTQAYLANKGSNCPYCGGDDITFGSLEVYDDGTVCQYRCCNACGKEWDDQYDLVGFHDLDN